MERSEYPFAHFDLQPANSVFRCFVCDNSERPIMIIQSKCGHRLNVCDECCELTLLHFMSAAPIFENEFIDDERATRMWMIFERTSEDLLKSFQNIGDIEKYVEMSRNVIKSLFEDRQARITADPDSNT